MSDNHITVFLTDWCPYCKRLVKALNSTETPFTAINVDDDVEAAAWVESVNDGNRIVPTVKYSDGTHATNPPASDVRRKLEELQG
ncbi:MULTISPECIES: mycoredoxin [unclassified Corynebacterium]|uniref:mycoredoxin n=1 Tax=unclassified Corynebacterium TaxID=2624378 RepID=UPI003523C69A